MGLFRPGDPGAPRWFPDPGRRQIGDRMQHGVSYLEREFQQHPWIIAPWDPGDGEAMDMVTLLMFAMAYIFMLQLSWM